MDSEFSTHELGLAAWLQAKGFKLLRIDRSANSPRCYFVFEKSDNCQKAIEQFWSYGGTVAPRTLSEVLRSLKERLFAGA